MKTAVSIPDDVFAAAERLAERTGKSRSQLFADALREYLARHSPEEITDTMNRVIDEMGAEPDPWTRTAAKRVFDKVDW